MTAGSRANCIVKKKEEKKNLFIFFNNLYGKSSNKTGPRIKYCVYFFCALNVDHDHQNISVPMSTYIRVGFQQPSMTVLVILICVQFAPKYCAQDAVSLKSSRADISPRYCMRTLTRYSRINYMDQCITT